MAGFRMTCPTCGDIQPPEARYSCTACGSTLVIDRAKVQGLIYDLPKPKVRRIAVDRRPFTARRGSHRG